MSRVDSAADALLARYRNEPWFVETKTDGKAVTLRVTPNCPFDSHRPVMGFPVEIVNESKVVIQL